MAKICCFFSKILLAKPCDNYHQLSVCFKQNYERYTNYKRNKNSNEKKKRNGRTVKRRKKCSKIEQKYNWAPLTVSNLSISSVDIVVTVAINAIALIKSFLSNFVGVVVDIDIS